MATVYMIPSVLNEEGYDAIPGYIRTAISQCEVFFAENERTARRYFKSLWREMVIDNYAWFTISEDPALITSFRNALSANKTIGIVSEAGCPGVADPGQALVSIAHEMNAVVKPLVGPSSILLALMASGMNGQQFRFAGYLPVDPQLRAKALKELETQSARYNATQIFIETPYRNNQMLEAICRACNPQTMLCIAADLTGKDEWIKTMPVKSWKPGTINLHKRPAIFLLQGLKSG